MVKPVSILMVHSFVKNLAMDWLKNLTLSQENLNILIIDILNTLIIDSLEKTFKILRINKRNVM